MRKFGVGVLAAALIVIGAQAARAQEAGTVGLVMTSGSSVGLTIQATDAIALRPTISISRSTSPGFADGERTTTAWSPGASLLLFVKSWDATRLYVSPQWVHNRATSNEAGTGELKATSNTFNAMLGVQHALGARFAVFGEVGGSRSSSESTSQGVSLGGKNTNWSSRSTIGGIFFF
jgi:hypothetical protein